ncbi:hypothetical protein T069G_00961 [Trichoderma breve]|uniref:Uncharacterized protein n=1 Tax=Trichoderma breve TaxID=2034170 RepID=A0A9W9ECZ0_9HYPO|nr:hypothetical protein T069G_00961 [Trichoderma breve]KAJ4864431.1 hypothetical protein T069G_00961 [Trichoderma breve]
MIAFNDSVFVWLDQPSPPSTPATLHVPSEPNPERRVQPQPRDREEASMGVYKHQLLCHLIVDALLRISKKRPLKWLASWREPGDEGSGDGETTTESESGTEPVSSDSDERPLGASINQLLDNIAHLQGGERPGPISASLYRSQFGYGKLGECSQPPPLAPGEERQEYDKAYISRRFDEYATEAALKEFRLQVEDVHIEGKHPKVKPAKPKPTEKP